MPVFRLGIGPSSAEGGVARPAGPELHQRRDDLLGDAQPAEVALAVDHRHGRVREPIDHVLPVREGHDVVVVAVPPAHRDLHVRQPKPQSRVKSTRSLSGAEVWKRLPLSRSSRNIALNSGRASRFLSPGGCTAA